jgi:hypothetical protein
MQNDKKQQIITVPIIGSFFTIIGVIFNVCVVIYNLPSDRNLLKIEWFRDEIKLPIQEQANDIETKWKIRIIAQNHGKNFTENKKTIFFKLNKGVNVLNYFIVNNGVEGELALKSNEFEYTFEKWKHKEKLEFEMLITCNITEPTIELKHHQIDIVPDFSLHNSSEECVPLILKPLLKNDSLKWSCFIVSIILIGYTLFILIWNLINSIRHYMWYKKYSDHIDSFTKIHNSFLFVLPSTRDNAGKKILEFKNSIPCVYNISTIIGAIIIMFYAIVSGMCIYYYL